MTLVRLQQILSSEIAKRTFLSRPPEPPAEVLLSDPLRSLFVGVTKILHVPFSWSFFNLTNPHIAVVGITGSGKSYFVKTLLIRASYVMNANAIIIDWAGEYKSWVRQSKGVIIALGKGDYINLLDLSGMKPLDRVKQIMNSLDILTDISMFPEQKRLTEEVIEQSYVNMGFVISERPPEGKDTPTLKDAIALLEEKLTEGTYEYPAELENAIYRLRQFAREGEDYFAKKSTIDLGKLAESGLVDIDLSGLPDERFRALAALFILQTLKEKMRAEGFSETQGVKAFVVLDEAWKIASDERSDAITIVREGRKYQFALIVASQNPTDINEQIFSNVGTTFILKTKLEKYLNFLQNSLHFSDFVRSETIKFGVGQATVDMSFKIALQFPQTFVLDKIYGEEPLYVYLIDFSDVLTQSELSSGIVSRDYQFEKEELKSKLIEFDMSNEAIDMLLSKMESNKRSIDILTFVKDISESEVSTSNIVEFLKSIGFDDIIISRIMSRVGV
ncbi:MAG: ATP-binding protein [Candidatus Marsarchaeota archaeon]|nr:ATP-binding protein [Candidatus Marsarchaeota archaeon]